MSSRHGSRSGQWSIITSFILISGTISADKNTKDSFNTLVLHYQYRTNRVGVCTLKAGFNFLSCQVDWVELMYGRGLINGIINLMSDKS